MSRSAPLGAVPGRFRQRTCISVGPGDPSPVSDPRRCRAAWRHRCQNAVDVLFSWCLRKTGWKGTLLPSPACFPASERQGPSLRQPAAVFPTMNRSPYPEAGSLKTSTERPASGLCPASCRTVCVCFAPDTDCPCRDLAALHPWLSSSGRTAWPFAWAPFPDQATHPQNQTCWSGPRRQAAEAGPDV